MRDQYIYEYALQHLQREKAEKEMLIEKVRALLGSDATPVTAVHDPSVPDWVLSASERAARAAAETPARKKRVLSAAARERIAAAQKKRWEAHRKAKAADAEPTKRATKKKRGKKS